MINREKRLIYIFSSLFGTLIDLSVFTGLMILLSRVIPSVKIFVATSCGRLLSTLFNYFVSKKIVFECSDPARQTFCRFYLLAACIMLCSYAGVFFLTHLLLAGGYWPTLIKACVDAILFFMNFFLQKKWVFKT